MPYDQPTVTLCFCLVHLANQLGMHGFHQMQFAVQLGFEVVVVVDTEKYCTMLTVRNVSGIVSAKWRNDIIF